MLFSLPFPSVIFSHLFCSTMYMIYSSSYDLCSSPTYVPISLLLHIPFFKLLSFSTVWYPHKPQLILASSFKPKLPFETRNPIQYSLSFLLPPSLPLPNTSHIFVASHPLSGLTGGPPRTQRKPKSLHYYFSPSLLCFMPLPFVCTPYSTLLEPFSFDSFLECSSVRILSFRKSRRTNIPSRGCFSTSLLNFFLPSGPDKPSRNAGKTNIIYNTRLHEANRKVGVKSSFWPLYCGL